MNTRRMNTSVRWLLTTWLLLAVILTLAGPVSVARAASFVVTNLNDSGKGSLRQAILAANAAAGADTITFSVSGTILLSETLGISDAAGLTIDGAGRSITISGNDTVRVMSVGGVLTLRNLTITDGNAGYYEGGGLVNFGTLTVTDSTFSNNSAYNSAGGGIYSYGTLTVTGSVFSGNTAIGDGGGIYNAGTLDVTDSTFSGNDAANGGGMRNYSGTATVTDSTFSGNRADVGGGIFNYSPSSTLTVTGSTFSGNTTIHDGGGIYNSNGTLEVSNSIFTGNTALGGAGILNAGTLNVTDSTFSDNRTGVQGRGGGIYSWGPLSVTNSTFSGNSADNSGGGIYNTGTLSVTDSTFSENNADSGGGLYSFYGTAAVTNSTFSGNRAPVGGGIFNDGQPGTLSPLTIRNTIVANSTGVNCTNNGSLTDGGGNLSWPDTTCPGLNADPLLGPLQDNGGPTQTHALLGGSPAIDAAVLANCPAADQRGVSRPQGAGCDIGAYEYESVVYSFSGFFPPVDNLPTFNVVQAGVGIPVRFSLGGDHGLNIFAVGYPVSAKIACGGAPQDAIEETVIVGASSLSYDAATDTYTYLWKTNKAWANTCRQLNLKLNDGTEHKANFKFVK